MKSDQFFGVRSGKIIASSGPFVADQSDAQFQHKANGFQVVRQDAPLAIHNVGTLRDNGCPRILCAWFSWFACESVRAGHNHTVQTGRTQSPEPTNALARVGARPPFGVCAHDIFAFDHIRISRVRGQVDTISGRSGVRSDGYVIDPPRELRLDQISQLSQWKSIVAGELNCINRPKFSACKGVKCNKL